MQYAFMMGTRYSAFAVDMGEGRIWITGGIVEGQMSMSTEILEAGSFSAGPPLPRATESHCMARVSETQYILAGGTSIDDGAYMFDTETSRWTSLEPMSISRKGLGCGVFTNQGKRYALYLAI